ncbi:hypothetical protein BJ944DRAFT_273000 [Cunninghamella echinulata]|nr:hypothetical protein BJ944DRAFT_273000 [Cunninghamella echinulata]
MLSPTSSKKFKNSSSCIRCRSLHIHCNKDDPCKSCYDSSKVCLYSKDTPLDKLTEYEQLVLLEGLLNHSRIKLNILDQYIEGLSQVQQRKTNHITLLSRYHWHIEYDLKSYISQHTLLMEGRSELDTVFWRVFKKNQSILERNYHSEVERFNQTVTTTSASNNKNNNDNSINNDNKNKLTTVDDNETVIPIDMATALISNEELKMLVNLYNDCFIFTSLPTYLCSDFHDDPLLQMLTSSVLCLMISHTSNLHRFHIDHHEALSKTFYRHGHQLYQQYVSENKYDILALHTIYNFMLFENENGYHQEAIQSRLNMDTMISELHDRSHTFSPWQLTVFAQLIWAIFMSDTTSNHSIRIPKKIINAFYMDLEKQRSKIADLNITGQIRVDYIYYRCRLTIIMEKISKTCYGMEATSVDGRDIKGLEDELWELYNILPQWVNSTIGINHIKLEDNHQQYHQHSNNNTKEEVHPVCQRNLTEVWMRRLRYHFLVEWHGAWLYLYQVILPPIHTTSISLQCIRIIQHSQVMVELLYLWAEDRDFFDCYCFPALHSIYLATNSQLYLLQLSHKKIKEKTFDILLKLFFVIQRSNMYHIYRNSPFIINIKNALRVVHQDFIE